MGRDTSAAIATASHSNAKSFIRSRSTFNTVRTRIRCYKGRLRYMSISYESGVVLFAFKIMPALRRNVIPMIMA